MAGEGTPWLPRFPSGPTPSKTRAPQPAKLSTSCRHLLKGRKIRKVIEQQDYEFLQAFWTRRAVIAYSLFAFNILIFILMTFAGGSDNPSTQLGFGVKSNMEIDNGETWRFITPIFLHIGLLHLAFNSYALWIVGPQVEKLYGGPRFFLLYLLTGIAGVAASYWYHPQYPSAGASGAIFGLFGVLLVFSFKYRKSVPAFFSSALGRGILMTVGINLLIGYTIPSGRQCRARGWPARRLRPGRRRSLCPSGRAGASRSSRFFRGHLLRSSLSASFKLRRTTRGPAFRSAMWLERGLQSATWLPR